MHKLRNKSHQNILEFMLMYIPETFHIPISKRKMRIFLSINNWNIDKVIRKFKTDEWSYCYPFCKD